MLSVGVVVLHESCGVQLIVRRYPGPSRMAFVIVRFADDNIPIVNRPPCNSLQSRLLECVSFPLTVERAL